MVMFGGNSNKTSKNQQTSTRRSFPATTTATTATTRDYPPMIDIYPKQSEDGGVVEEEKKEDGEYRNAPSSLSKQPVVEQQLSKESSGSRLSNKSSSGNNKHVVQTFRTCSQEVRKTSSPKVQPRSIGIRVAPVIEIPVDAEAARGGAADVTSSPVSSLGADETAVAPKPSKKSWRQQQQQQPQQSSQQDRCRFPISGGIPAPASAPPPQLSPLVKNSTLTTDWIEKLVEERLQAHLAVLEVRMENQLLRATQQMEEQTASKFKSLEDKIAMLMSKNAATDNASAATAPSAVETVKPTLRTGNTRSAPSSRAVARQIGW
jgi:hypothetical protein